MKIITVQLTKVISSRYIKKKKIIELLMFLPTLSCLEHLVANQSERFPCDLVKQEL